MTWGLVVAGGALAGGLVAGCSGAPGGSSGSGSCAAPQVTVSPEAVGLGETVQVTGRYFMDSCADTNDAPPMHPLTGMRVVLTPDGAAPRELGRVDAAGELGRFDARLRIPADTLPGPATVSVGGAEPFRLTIE